MAELTAVRVLKESKKSIFTKNQTATTVMGTVVNSKGQSIPNVIVTLGGKSHTTDLKGAFLIERARKGPQIFCLSHYGHVMSNVGSIEVKASTSITVEIQLPRPQTSEPVARVVDKQWVRLIAVSQRDPRENISVLGRIDEEGCFDKTLETYGHLNDWKEEQFVRYPFILHYDGEKGILDLAGWAKAPQVIILDVYNKKIAIGASIRRMWEDLGSMEGSEYIVKEVIALG